MSPADIHAFPARLSLTIEPAEFDSFLASYVVPNLKEVQRRVDRLIAERNDLLAALKDLVDRCDGDEGVRCDGSNIRTEWAHAVIALVEGK